MSDEVKTTSKKLVFKLLLSFSLIPISVITALVVSQILANIFSSIDQSLTILLVQLSVLISLVYFAIQLWKFVSRNKKLDDSSTLDKVSAKSADRMIVAVAIFGLIFVAIMLITAFSI